LIDLYDAEISFNDATFGALLEKLRELELYDSTLIIFVSDHGEEFHEHGGWQHGSTLYEEQLHVPFLLRLPNGELAGQSVDALAQLVDVLPTVLDSLGEPVPNDLDGQSLLPAIEGDPVSGRVGIAHLELDVHRLEAIVDGNRKLIRWLPVRPYSRVELYELDTDQAEQVDLSGEQEIGLGVLQRRLDESATVRVPMSREEADIPPEIEERLRALGYLQ
jgi:arylsulfatase A-like enzyme